MTRKLARFVASVWLVVSVLAIFRAPNLNGAETNSVLSSERLHPLYKLPARCFAYVGDPADSKTWKLPYLLPDGSTDMKRLPAAAEAVTIGYRGKKVSGIPDDQVPDVLVRLGRAAARAGKMPYQNPRAAAIYRSLQNSLVRLNRLDEIKSENSTH